MRYIWYIHSSSDVRLILTPVWTLMGIYSLAAKTDSSVALYIHLSRMHNQLHPFASYV